MKQGVGSKLHGVVSGAIMAGGSNNAWLGLAALLRRQDGDHVKRLDTLLLLLLLLGSQHREVSGLVGLCSMCSNARHLQVSSVPPW